MKKVRKIYIKSKSRVGSRKKSESGRKAEKVRKKCGKKSEILASSGNLAKVRKKCGKSAEMLDDEGNQQ